MLSAFVPVCAGLLWSVTCTVKFAVPFGPVGVPVIFPVESIASPAGKLPALMLNVSVPSPPVAATVWLYAVPSVPAGSVVVVIDGGAGRFTVTANACVAVCTGLLPSVTFTVKFAVPVGPVGVPEMSPALLIVNPAGNEPALTLNASGASPVATTCWLYAAPSVPAGSVVVVIVGAAGRFTTMLNACVADCAPAEL